MIAPYLKEAIDRARARWIENLAASVVPQDPILLDMLTPSEGARKSNRSSWIEHSRIFTTGTHDSYRYQTEFYAEFPVTYTPRGHGWSA